MTDQADTTEATPVAFPHRRHYGCVDCGSYNHTAGAIWYPRDDNRRAQ